MASGNATPWVPPVSAGKIRLSADQVGEPVSRSETLRRIPGMPSWFALSNSVVSCSASVARSRPISRVVSCSIAASVPSMRSMVAGTSDAGNATPAMRWTASRIGAGRKEPPVPDASARLPASAGDGIAFNNSDEPEISPRKDWTSDSASRRTVSSAFRAMSDPLNQRPRRTSSRKRRRTWGPGSASMSQP